MKEQDEVLIGTRDGWGQQVPFGIRLPDFRQQVYLVGKTGAGKTTLLWNMITQLIALGHGVGLFDPHGDVSGKDFSFGMGRSSSPLKAYSGVKRHSWTGMAFRDCAAR